MKIIVFLIIFSYANVFSFSYDSASYAAQQGKWKDAHEKLQKLLIDAPDNSELLYDAGIAAHQLGNFAQAITYFSRAAEYASRQDLRNRAHFNAGNACVAHKNLRAALDHYEKALASNPDDEYARHNYDRVKQMLEEQNKDQDQDKKDEQNKEDEQDKTQENNKDQNNQQQDGNDEQNGQQGQQGDKQQDGSSQQQNSDNEQSQSNEGSNTDQSNARTDGKDQRDKKQQQSQSSDKQEGNGDQKFNQQTTDKQGEGDKQQTDKHQNTPEKENNNINSTNVSSESGQEQDENENALNEIEKKLDNPFLMKILDDQEARDKAMNKQLMNAKIRQHGGKNGQNCW